MAVKLEQVAEYLKAMGLKFDHNEEKERIVLLNGDEKSTYAHFIRARDDGRIFEWQMQILDDNKDNLHIKEHQHAGLVLSHILYLNYQTKFGTWEYDPTDGDIRLAVEIPLEDAIMTEKQFARICDYMLKDGSSHAEDITHIMKTGEVPEDDTEEQMMAMLEQILADLKAAKSDSDDDTPTGI